MYKELIVALVFFAALGGFLGLALALVDKKMAVRSDHRISDITDLLPGANCGGCGYAGCAALAEAIVKGEAPANKCAGVKKENLEKIGAIMGVSEPLNAKRRRAVVHCHGTSENATQKYKYMGIADCAAAAKLHGGSKLCSDGCIGLGNCVAACKFKAISVVNGVAVVNADKCVGCGACVASCPKGLIELIPADSYCYVACKAQAKGAAVKEFCAVGCIGCGICVRGCEVGAIQKHGFSAKVEQDKCVSCGVCVSKCPRGIIVKNERL